MEEACQPKRRDAKYTLEEVSKHNKPTDAWIAIRGKVYNITNWMDQHPGGRIILETLAGRDVTDPFISSHPAEVEAKKLPHLQIGVVVGWKPTPLQEDFWKVAAALEAEGKFQTNYGYYLKKLGWLILLLTSAVYLMLVRRTLLSVLVGSALLGLFWQQLSFLGHDFAHNALTHRRDTDYWFSVVVMSFLGVSMEWWRRSHNVHHVVTNSIESDPDIQHLPVFAVDSAYLDKVYSTYHRRTFSYDGIARFFVCHQHLLYYVVMSLARVNLYLQGFILLLNFNTKVTGRFVEFAALAFYQCWYIYLLTLLPNNSLRLLSFLVSHAVCGLIHVQITLSHFAMPAYHGTGFTCTEDDFFHTQIASSMNVDCPEWLDWLHGGLQFQVEHHLLPRLPRHNLRYAMTKYIVPLCKKYGLEYQSYTFLEGNIRVIRALKAIAMQARQKSKTA